jgi:hypothetical protein
VSTYTLFASQHATGKRARPSKKPTPDFVGILLVLVRLVDKKTDLVVTINVPHVPGEYAKEQSDLEAGKPGPLLEAAMLYQREILESFEIKDWSLFVDD